MGQLTVSKLIRELNKMPKDAKVYIASHDYGVGQGDPAYGVIDMNSVETEEDSDSNYIKLSSPSLCETNSVVISG